MFLANSEFEVALSLVALAAARVLCAHFCAHPSSTMPFTYRYHNESITVNEKLGRFILTRNSSLYIMNGRPEDTGSWQLRDSIDGTCMVTYNLNLSGSWVHAPFVGHVLQFR